MKYKITKAIIFIAVCLYAIPAQNQEILTNGGFEEGMASWQFNTSGSAVAASEIVQDSVHSGINSLKITIDQPGTNSTDIALSYSAVSVQKELVYTLTFWAKSDSNGNKVTIEFSNLPENSYNFVDSTNVYLTTDWKAYQVIIPSTVPVTSNVQFSLHFGKSSGIFYLDDFVFEKRSDTWYEGAELRIEKYRKGNFAFKIEDSGGQPVSDSIQIKLKKHSYPWGVAIDFNDNPFGNVYTSAQAVIAPADSEIYQTERWAQYLAYALPVESSKKYELTIKLAEIYFNVANARLFDVYINGIRIMQNIDKYLLAGGKNIAFDTTVVVLAMDTTIKIEFFAIKDNASIMGIELADSSSGVTILRLNCGGSSLTTHSGNAYMSDQPYIDRTASNPNTTSDDWQKAAMYKYCNYGVCGNQFKWSGIEPNQGILNYAPFENTLSWFQRVGWDMRAHTLLWGGTSSTDYHELPQWVGALPPVTMYDTCKMRITREVSRYKGIVKEYDVMNEPTHATYLQSRVGDSINWNCFKWAYEADSTARFFVNDYNVVEYQDQTNAYVDLIETMLANGAPLTGIGSQCHFGTSVDLVNYKNRFDQLAQFGLPIKITEFDMDVENMTQRQQAIETSKLMRLAFSHPAIEGLVFWGITDPGWRSDVGNLINQDKTPKLAADSLFYLVQDKWSTKINDRTDTSGIYRYRAIYGDYEVLVKFGGTWKKFNISNEKKDEAILLVLKEDEALVTSPNLVKVTTVAPTGLELTFDKPMSDPVLEYKNFKVFDTTNNTIQSAAIKAGDANTIVLVMQQAITEGNYIPVSYFPGNQTSVDGGILEPFGPVIDSKLVSSYISASTTGNGRTILIDFKNKLLETSVDEADFIIKVNNTTRNITGVGLGQNMDTLYFTLADQILSNRDIITVSYQSGSLQTTDSLRIANFYEKSVTNKVIVPTLISARTDDATSISLRFSAAMADPSAQSPYFNVNAGVDDIEVTGTELSSSSNKYVILTLATAVSADADISITYTPGTLSSIDGIPVPAFTVNVNNTLTGVGEELNSDPIRYYPNPISDRLFISNIQDHYLVTISNLLGQKQLELCTDGSDTIEINTSDLKSGFYIVTLTGNGDTKAFKVYKQD
jgi:uncharacterized repeat protein (TIGR02059 family)